MNKNILAVRIGTVYVAAVMIFSSFTPLLLAQEIGEASLESTQSVITADIKANGSDGPVTLTSGEFYTYSWNSDGAAACEISAPTGDSGISLSGNGGPILSDHPWYPAVGSSITLTFSCTDGTASVSDTVTISVEEAVVPTVITADIKANGSDGPVTLTSGEFYTYSWNSDGATACEISAPTGDSGISLSGNAGPIEIGHPWYPSASSSVTLTLNCTDGTDSVSDSVSISLAGVTPPTNDVTADIRANGSDGPVTITAGDSYTYSWNSTGATACEISAPTGDSGISLSGNGGPIPSDHPWYPTASSSVTLTLNCTDGVDNATDAVTISLASTTTPPTGLTADIKINGQDGTVTIDEGEEWTYSWNSTGATACELGSPTGDSGISLSGNGGPIPSGHPWYPSESEETTLTLRCTDGTSTVTDTATVRIEDDDNGGGGGGGGGGPLRKPRSSGGTVAGAVTGPVSTADVCPWLTSYLRIGYQNDPIQVMKLQAFLIHFEGFTNVAVTGTFDQATLQAVHAFQSKYSQDVLAPWGINYSTGYVYITTLRKVNEIVCGPQAPVSVPRITPSFPETGPQIGKDGGFIGKFGPIGGTVGTDGNTSGPELAIGGPTEGQDGLTESDTRADRDSDKTEKIGLAAALTAFPESIPEAMTCLYQFVLILIVLYILGSVLESVLYKDTPENKKKRFYTKWGAISLGHVAALAGAYLLGAFCLLLPLLITLVLSLIWLATYPKHNSMRASAKSWKLVLGGRARTMWNEAKDGGNNKVNPAPKPASATPVSSASMKPQAPASQASYPPNPSSPTIVENKNK